MSTSAYDPDDFAVPSYFYTAFLSQRDVALRVPINYVTIPGIALTAACFSDNVYEDSAAQKCFSNLMAIGFRRFVIDLYWDTSRQTWSLCPVQLNETDATPSNTGSIPTALTTASSSSSETATLSYGTILGSGMDRRVEVAATVTSKRIAISGKVWPRQTVDTTSTLTAIDSFTSTFSFAGNSSQTLTATSSASQPTQVAANSTLYEIGPYTCTSQISLTNFTDVLLGHFKATENSLNATFKHLIINLHAASPFGDPTASPQAPSMAMLPAVGNYLGELLNTSLSSYIYTPYMLANQRANLNLSWYSVSSTYQPLSAYLAPQEYGDGDFYTVTGWPSESFVELQHALRFVAGIGSIDPQMQGYNFAADVDTLFPPGELSVPIDVSLSATGDVTNGCLFETNNESSHSGNSSWAVSSDIAPISDIDAVYRSASNLTSCGISPILNETIGASANVNGSNYSDYIINSIWSWAKGEPDDTQNDGSNYNCAIFNASNSGRWQVASCSDRHYGACRTGNLPYSWTITSQNGQYAQMDDACGDSTFAVPRTALENDYLQSAVRSWQADPDSDNDATVFWINFNDIDVRDCWVTGVNMTCPYVERSADATRTVVVPTIAGVIVGALALLLIFVKCAGNRQTSKKRRRRGEGGWDYEGVPS
ncbi:hypothetical protein MBLNU459_g8030t1 [Dothideomycetes sp. NU459]